MRSHATLVGNLGWRKHNEIIRSLAPALKDLTPNGERESEKDGVIVDMESESAVSITALRTTGDSGSPIPSVYEEELHISGHKTALVTTRSGHDRSGHDCSGHDRSGHDCSGHDRSGHDCSGQDRSGHDRSGQDRSDQTALERVDLEVFNKLTKLERSAFLIVRLMHLHL